MIVKIELTTIANVLMLTEPCMDSVDADKHSQTLIMRVKISLYSDSKL